MILSTVTLVLLIYTVGGLTLLPLVVLLVYLYGLVVLPKHEPATLPLSVEESKAGIHDDETLQLLSSPREDDFTAGYFAVCREYVPGGVNGKAPERTSPAGETIAKESPTAYQSIYRSLFDRRANSTSLDAGKLAKRAANIFFVVLRHGHLILFDNSEQLDVRHVISLSLYKVSIHGDSVPVPEGELWIKRNCIRLRRRVTPDIGGDPKESSFYLFSDNCSEKEDFYHAVLQSQRKAPGNFPEPPGPQVFETEHLIKLIRQLHASEDNVQARWLNALVGRIFLALYKTSALKDMIRAKITKKISRVAKPAFISSLSLRDVELGDSAPIFVKPRLKEMAVDGSLTLEADVKYTGKFKAVVAALARIDLGQRFKPMEVDLVLAGVLKKLEGHILVHVKPPPSNRLWVTFETMPKIELSLEPIVSSRQITYGVILRAIESRIREVVSETIVFPNWDDLPVFDTENLHYRGGIWVEDEPELHNTIAISTDKGSDQVVQEFDLVDDQVGQSSRERTNSMPNFNSECPPTPGDAVGTGEAGDEVELKPSPMTLRSNTVAVAPVPSPAAVTRVPVRSYANRERRRRPQDDAQSSIRSISSRLTDAAESQSQPPHKSEISRKAFTSAFEPVRSSDSLSKLNDAAPTLDFGHERVSQDSLAGVESAPDTRASDGAPSHGSGDKGLADYPEEGTRVTSNTETKAAVINRSITTATAAAKKWGTGFLQLPTSKAPSSPASSSPIGRGKPLPPPGQPLPGPRGIPWTAAAFGTIKRKPLSSERGSISSTASKVPSDLPPAVLLDNTGEADVDATRSTDDSEGVVHNPTAEAST